MPVNFEVKGMLARLLATEDIIVEHRKVSTACFDVQKRILTLPMWEKASNNIYDLLLSHESAHALYTPNEDWTVRYKIPPQIVNVVEDARIEKLIKRRYAGLAKTFFNGYKELCEDDFFELGNDDVSKYNLADRINLHFKIGTQLNLTFTPEEQSIVDLISECETFEDVLEAAEILFKFCKMDITEFQSVDFNASSKVEIVEMPDGSQSDGPKQTIQVEKEKPKQEEEKKPENNDKKDTPGGGGEEEDEKSSGEKPADSESSASSSSASVQKTVESPGSQKAGAVEVKTADALSKAIENLTNNDSSENHYLEIPELDLDEIIIPTKDIHYRCKEAWSTLDPCVFTSVDRAYQEFKRSAQKEVGYLVKEFECRKAADAYVRANTARTGVLDCSKLHTYKYNDDIFKKITTLPDGKNHGLIFILDWSGSMGEYILDTIKQLYSLIWFCKKVSIPFEVYAFTTDYPYVKYDEKGNTISRKPAYKEKPGIFQVGGWFSLLNFLSGKSNTSTLETQMRNIFRIACVMESKYKTAYRIPMGLTLSGTPLSETLIALHQIIPKFQAETKVQKVQCVILTDGDACMIKHHQMYKSPYKQKEELGVCNVWSNSILRNRRTGRTYLFGEQWWDVPNTFLRNLTDSFPNTNFIGIRLVSSRDASSFIRRYTGETKEYTKVMETWRKEKAFTIKSSPYHSYFGISSSDLSQNDEFSVAENASKIQIKSAFIKSLKVKKMNKKILGDFIELIV